MFWFAVAGGLVGAFYGAVLAFILQRLKKLHRFPYWWVITGSMAGALAGVLNLLSYRQ